MAAGSRRVSFHVMKLMVPCPGLRTYPHAQRLLQLILQDALCCCHSFSFHLNFLQLRFQVADFEFTVVPSLNGPIALLHPLLAQPLRVVAPLLQQRLLLLERLQPSVIPLTLLCLQANWVSAPATLLLTSLACSCCLSSATSLAASASCTSITLPITAGRNKTWVSCRWRPRETSNATVLGGAPAEIGCLHQPWLSLQPFQRQQGCRAYLSRQPAIPEPDSSQKDMHSQWAADDARQALLHRTIGLHVQCQGEPYLCGGGLKCLLHLLEAPAEHQAASVILWSVVGEARALQNNTCTPLPLPNVVLKAPPFAGGASSSAVPRSAPPAAFSVAEPSKAAWPNSVIRPHATQMTSESCTRLRSPRFPHLLLWPLSFLLQVLRLHLPSFAVPTHLKYASPLQHDAKTIC